MVSVNIYEAKSQLSRLIAAVETRGERVVLCRNGVPIADIVPHQKDTAATLQPDPALRGAEFLSDPTAPLSNSDWPEAQR